MKMLILDFRTSSLQPICDIHDCSRKPFFKTFTAMDLISINTLKEPTHKVSELPKPPSGPTSSTSSCWTIMQQTAIEQTAYEQAQDALPAEVRRPPQAGKTPKRRRKRRVTTSTSQYGGAPPVYPRPSQPLQPAIQDGGPFGEDLLMKVMLT